MYFSPGRRPLSRASSFTPLPISQITGAPIGADRFHQGIALMRSASLSSLHLPASPHARTTFDYSPPTDTSNGISARILPAHFQRRNITTNFNTDISQLCKLSEKWGNIRALEGGGIAQPSILAIATSKGYIQIWDVKAKKATMTWPTTKEITALAWNGPILSVGGIKGSIRHYDTRLPASKLKEQARQVIRNHGQFLASGDAAGTVHCWELGQKVPLEVGEFVSRRKKIHTRERFRHPSAVEINAKDANSNSLNPGKLDIGTVITGIHFSPHCKEILTTHGAQVGERAVNAIAVHSFPSLRDVTTYSLPGAQLGAIGDSVLDGTGTKLIFATPSTNKIDVCTKRQSFNEHASLMIR
ncbi:hypothetical protein BJ912DRAFT_980291 [Pholiota molesta]|nr:hypothetical protein BJ912DRAFT_980291 [Pholiota molesta]